MFKIMNYMSKNIAAANIKRMYNIKFLFIIDSSLSSMSTLIHLYRVYKENSTVSRAHVLRFKWKMTFYYVLLLLAIFITNNEVYHEPDFLFYKLILALFMKGIVFHCHLQLRLWPSCVRTVAWVTKNVINKKKLPIIEKTNLNWIYSQGVLYWFKALEKHYKVFHIQFRN